MRKYSVMITAVFLLTVSMGSAPHAQASGKYWFQVGAWAANAQGEYGKYFGIPTTGASVEIRVNYRHFIASPDGWVAYWVGINLPNDAFIQVGYEISANSGLEWFWEYFPPGTASQWLNYVYLGGGGDEYWSNGTWVKFAIQSQGTDWSVYVNGEETGSVNLGVSNSGTNGPYAVAEVPGAVNAATIMGPVEFRNLSYRDIAGQWHLSEVGVAMAGYAVNSPSYSGNYPYGVQVNPGANNDWFAGSNLNNPIQAGSYLWPWFQVNVEDLPQGYTFPNGWYLYDWQIDLTNIPASIPITPYSRYYLEGWYVNGALQSSEYAALFTVTGNLTLKPNYVKQWLVQVNSKLGTVTGAGWYNDGATATITVAPTFIPADGILGNFGVGETFTGWNGHPSTNGETRIQVTQPITLNAAWSTTYGVLPYYLLLIIPLIALLLYRRKLQNLST